MVGWDEILEGGLAPGAVVMSWRGEEGGIAAASAGHDVVIGPEPYVYLDWYQAPSDSGEPLAIHPDRYTDVAKMYGYEPVPAALTEEQRGHVLGSQGQLWTEYVPTPEHAEYMLFPRLCARSRRSSGRPASATSRSSSRACASTSAVSTRCR